MLNNRAFVGLKELKSSKIQSAKSKGFTQLLTWVVGHWRVIKTAGLAHLNMLK